VSHRARGCGHAPFLLVLYMGFVLREGVSFCESGGRLVFLDVTSDRYFCLENEADRALGRLAGGEPLTREDETVLADLVADGLLAPASEGDRPQACSLPPEPERSLIDEELPVRSAALAHAFWRLAHSALAFKTRPLRAIIASTTQRKAQLGFETEAFAPIVAEVAGAFKRSALIAAPLDRCLPRSFATAHALLDRKLRSDLVFGVRLHPFGAHCWVQHGRTLVNETLDQVRNFTPILVV
jgi:hypothetical protein